MKKAALLLGSLALFFVSGCATEDFVKKQTDPLADRIGKLEDKVATVESKLGQAGLFDADKKSIQDAKDMAAQAMDAAKRSEAAAEQAGQSAKKSQKMFELQQKKIAS